METLGLFLIWLLIYMIVVFITIIVIGILNNKFKN